MAPVRLAVVDDFEIIVSGVAGMLEPFTDRIDVVELDANRSIDTDVDVALYDSFAQGEAHTEDLQGVLDNPHARHVAMYTWRFDPDLLAFGLSRGLDGYLSKGLEADQLVAALERIAGGETVVAPDRPTDSRAARGSREPNPDRPWPGREYGLSEREAEVLALITAGRSNPEIADLLYLSVNSIKTHIRGLYRKIGVSRRTEAVLWGVDHGMRFDHRQVDDPDQG